MRIDRITIKDFRNHESTDLALDRLNILRGPNHSGKSTVAQAIEFALTGRCDSTDAKGTGADALIRHSADKAIIQLALHANKDVDFRCSLTPKSGRTVTVRDPEDPAYAGDGVLHWFASLKPVFSCLLNTRYFIGLKPAEQKTLLSSIVLPSEYDFPQHITDLLASSGVKVDSKLPPFEFIEAAYDAAYSRRRDINRDLKGVHVPESLPAPTGVSSSIDAHQQLANLRAELDAISKNSRERAAERNKLSAEIARTQERVEGIDAKLRTEDEHLREISKQVLSAKKVKDLEVIAAHQKKADEYERELGIIRDGITAVKGVLGIFEKLDGQKVCPVCQREITDEFLTSAMAPHVEHREKLLQQERETLKLLAALGDPAGAQKQLDQNAADVASRKRCKEIIAESTSTRDSLQSELEAMQQRLAAMPVAGPNERADAINAQITDIENQLSAVSAYEQRKQEITRAQDQYSKLAQVSHDLDSLVEYFGKDGIKAELLGDSVGGFVKSMNDVLVEWGYQCILRMEPYGFQVISTDANGCGFSLPLELLSNSERMRFSVAFQIALAQVSGIRLVVVDEADMLDSVGRDTFYDMLLSADIDQAIAIGTSEEIVVPDVPGTKFYMVSDGNVQELKAEAIAA